MPFNKKWHQAGFGCENPKCTFQHVEFASRKDYDAAFKPEWFIKKVADHIAGKKSGGSGDDKPKKGKEKGKGKGKGKKDAKGSRQSSPSPQAKQPVNTNNPLHMASGPKAKAFVMKPENVANNTWGTFCKWFKECTDENCLATKYHMTETVATAAVNAGQASRKAIAAAVGTPAK
jgi:hypothetical protein